jgi:hypothetical protein
VTSHTSRSEEYTFFNKGNILIPSIYQLYSASATIKCQRRDQGCTQPKKKEKKELISVATGSLAKPEAKHRVKNALVAYNKCMWFASSIPETPAVWGRPNNR